jgi:hypothetical protein
MNYIIGSLHLDTLYDDLYVLTAMRGENIHFYNIRTGSKHCYPLGYLPLSFISL